MKQPLQSDVYSSPRSARGPEGSRNHTVSNSEDYRSISDSEVIVELNMGLDDLFKETSAKQPPRSDLFELTLIARLDLLGVLGPKIKLIHTVYNLEVHILSGQ